MTRGTRFCLILLGITLLLFFNKKNRHMRSEVFLFILFVIFELNPLVAFVRRPVSIVGKKLRRHQIPALLDNADKNFRDIFFSKDQSDTPQSRRWGRFEKYAQFYSLEKFTSQISLVVPLLFLTSLIGGVAYYSSSHHWNFAMSLYFSTQTIMGEMYNVPFENRAADQAFTIGLRTFGSICVAGALGAFGATLFGRIVDQQRKKLVESEDLNNDGRIDNFEKIYFYINKAANTIGWFDHKTKYLTVLATLVWFALGVWYEVAVDGSSLSDSLVFIGGALSAAGVTGPPCVGGDEVVTCAVPTDLSYFLTLYLLTGVPLFTATVGQFAQLVVEKAVRADEAMRMLAPITEEEYAFASTISDIGTYSPDSDAIGAADDIRGDSSGGFVADEWQLDFGEFVIMNLLRLQRLDTEEISFFGRMFRVIDVNGDGAISREELRGSFMYASFVAAQLAKQEADDKGRGDGGLTGTAGGDMGKGEGEGGLLSVDSLVDFVGVYALAPLLLVGTLMTGTLYYFFKLHWTLPTSLFYSVQVVFGHNYGVPSLPTAEDSAFTLGLHTWASVFLGTVLGAFASGFVRSSIRTGRKKALLMGPIDLNGDGEISWFETAAFWMTNFALSIDVDKDRVKIISAVAFMSMVALGTLFCTSVEGWDPLQALIFTVGAISSSGEPAPPCMGGDQFTCAIDPPLAYFFTLFILTGAPLFAALLGQFSSLVLDKAVRTDEINKIFSPVTDEEFERVGVLSGALTECSMDEIDMGEFVVMMALRLGRLDEEGLAGMRELFNSLDTSGDGLVSFNEMRARVNCDNEKCWLW